MSGSPVSILLCVAVLASALPSASGAQAARVWIEDHPAAVVPLDRPAIPTRASADRTAPLLTPEFADPAAYAPPRATAIRLSVTSGGWGDPLTWGGVVPGPTDDVIIADGTTVTIDVAGSCANLTVGQGVSGVLQYEATVARTLIVGGNVAIAAGGTFRSSLTGGQSAHALSLSGNLTNDGVLDFSTNGNTAAASLTFTGASSNTLGGGGVTTDLSTLAINKGAPANVLELNPAQCTVRGLTTTPGTTAGFLTLTSGTFKLSGTFTLSTGLFTGTGNYTIPAAGGLTLANPNATIAARAGSMNLSGRLRVDAGTLEVGTASGNGIAYASGSFVTLSGGAVRVAGRFSGTTTTSTTNYLQSDGTLTVCAVGNTSSNLASFDLPTSGSSFDMSGGSIVVQQLASVFVDYRNNASTPGPSGGTVQFGNANSGGPKEYWATGLAPSVVISNTSAPHALRLVGPLTVWGNATIRPGTTLIMNSTTPVGQPWLQLGPGITNDGTIVCGVAGSRLTFGGLVAQTYGGSGVLGTASAPLALLELDDPLGLTLSMDSPVIVASRCNLFRGTLSNSGRLRLGIGGASGAATQIGGATPGSPGGAYDAAPTFDIGTAGYSLLYSSETVARTSGFEVPPSRGVSLLRIDNANGVTLAGGDADVTGSLTLVSGILHTGTAKVSVLAPGAVTRVAGHVDGNLEKDVPLGAPSRGFEVGDAIAYAPVTIAFSGVSSAGRVTARTDAGDLALPPGSGIDYAKSVNRHFTLTGSGGLAFDSTQATFGFLAGDVDPGADPAAFAVRRLDGATWSATTPGTRGPTSTEASWGAGLGGFAIGELLPIYTIGSSAGSGGSIAPLGAIPVVAGDDQAFLITPDACFVVADVLVDGLSIGAVTGHTFTDVQADHTIAASFAPATFTIAASAGPGGAIVPGGAAVVACGADQAFVITPDSCSVVADVLVDGVSIGAVTGHTFTNVQTDHTITVSFAPTADHTITASAGAGGAITPSGPVSVACGSDRGFVITPDSCFVVADLLVDGLSIGAATGYTFINVQADHTIAASFAPRPDFTITASAGAGGAITPSGNVPVVCGGDQPFTVVPQRGFATLDVLVDGGSVGPVTAYTFTDVGADHSIAASFVENVPPDVTVLSPDGGESVFIDSLVTLSWLASDEVGVTCVDVFLSRAGLVGPWEAIAPCVPNTGSYDWLVTGPATTVALLRVAAHDLAGNVGLDQSDSLFTIGDAPVVSASDAAPILGFAIERVSPNPTSHSARIAFAIPRRSAIRLGVYDAQGREVARLADGDFEPGRYAVTWTGDGASGRLASGVYFIRIRTPAETLSRRIVLNN